MLFYFFASFFSLLNPAVMIAEEFSMCVWLIILIGFLCGVLLLEFGNYFISLHSNSLSRNSIRRSILLFISITLHNIPEGLVLGVAFGSVPYSGNATSIVSAIILITSSPNSKLNSFIKNISTTINPF